MSPEQEQDKETKEISIGNVHLMLMNTLQNKRLIYLIQSSESIISYFPQCRWSLDELGIGAAVLQGQMQALGAKLKVKLTTLLEEKSVHNRNMQGPICWCLVNSEAGLFTYLLWMAKQDHKRKKVNMHTD